MNERKQHVLKMAHQLFIEKGFQATSIQDILDFSGISKGTFYKYFSSKNELLIALFKTLFEEIEKKRNDMLIGKNPTDINIFKQQVELHLKTNRMNKLITLFEEVFSSNDKELKDFLNQGQLRMIRWISQRFLDIFGEDKEEYLLDCSIIFMGILNHNLRYHTLAFGSTMDIHEVVRYSVARIVKIVEEVADARDQLFPPDLLDNWLPNCRKMDQAFRDRLQHNILILKKNVNNNEEQSRLSSQFLDLLDFIQDELLDSKEPRKFLIDSAFLSLRVNKVFINHESELQKLEFLVNEYFAQFEETN